MPRPKTPLISRGFAVRSALEIIDAEGLENFSLEKLARRIGVKSPSLYHHFTNKSDLLTELARHLLSGIPVGEDPPEGQWTEWFVTVSVRTYRTIMNHPRAAGLLASYFPSSQVMPSHETGARILAERGIPGEARYVIMRGLEKLVFGMAFADASEVSAEGHLPRGIDLARWPNFEAAVEASRGVTREEFLERAVRLYLAGVERTYLVADAGSAARPASP